MANSNGMKNRTMSDGEILKSYREAKDKRHQVSVLADLNVCTKGEIIDILIAGGVRPQELPRKRQKKASVPADIAAEVKKHEASRREEVTLEALLFLKNSLAKDIEKLEADYQAIRAEYVGKIAVIDSCLEGKV